MVFGNMGDDLRHRRGVHARPIHGREPFLRRIPRQRPGRGRCRRNTHAAEHHGGRAQGRRLRSSLAHVDVRFLNRERTRIHFFASRLKYSRWAEVTIVPDEQTETLVRTLVDHFTAIGGIPLLAVFDRPKTVALKWAKDGHVTEWNPLFAGVALDLGLGIEVCWPSSPRQKGSIENLVGWVKGSFFKQRRFFDDADLRTQLAEWRTEVNTQRPCRATHVIPAVRLEEERPRLRALKIAPADSRTPRARRGWPHRGGPA